MLNNSRDLAEEIRRHLSKGQKVVFVSGNFNIVHPGHLRLFEFAAGCGDILIVGLHRQGYGNTVLSEELRLESLRMVSCIDFSLILPTSPENFISDLQPDIVVKGKEHEVQYNPELSVVESYGGKLLFSSGEVRFSSLELLRRELNSDGAHNFVRPHGYAERHNFTSQELVGTVKQFKSLKVVVVGDLIVDEYITCDALGMSQEDPTLVVSPLKYDKFIGGAAIVAAHARGLGAEVSYFGVCGQDTTADFAREIMKSYDVDICMIEDDSRPTTLKQRYRANGKTLLRVSHLRQHDIGTKLIDRLFEQVVAKLKGANLILFSDFNYGCLPQVLVDRLVSYCKANNVKMAADSQASSQLSDVSRFKGMTLITPTEREARLACHDSAAGLVVLADKLRETAECENVIITLGAEGVLIHAPHTTPDNLITDRLPALNAAPKDVAGAGDCLLATTAMALTVKTSIWRASYLGSIAAACQVSRIGNSPLQASTLISELLK